MIYHFELLKGNLKAEDLRKIDPTFFIVNVGAKSPDKLYIILNRYSHDSDAFCLFHGELWQEYFETGHFNTEVAEKKLNSSRFFLNENTPSWKKLWHYTDLDDEEFETIYADVNEKYQSKFYNDIYIVFHVYGLFLSLKNNSLIELDLELHNDIIRSYIDDAFAGNLAGLPLISKGHIRLGESYDGLGFCSKKAVQFEEMVEYYSAKYDVALEIRYKEIAKELLDSAVDNPDKFIQSLLPHSSEAKGYSSFSLLSYMPPVKFLDVLLKMPANARNDIGFVFEERCKYLASDFFMYSEISWLIEIKKLLEQEIERRKGKVSSVSLRSIVEHRLSPVIQKAKDRFNL